ncbi:MAG TPA: hypothetical protein VNT75_19390 [Symbiobacteriaceae bacterium]|nr:hypothetical protein [Symbiobacteriaceae bacterium]
MLTIAQAAALLQAIIWMVVLSHGGWGSSPHQWPSWRPCWQNADRGQASHCC